MSKATIPIAATLTREDGSAITLADLASLNVMYSVDGGVTFIQLDPLPPETTSIEIDGLGVGSVTVLATETDKQTPPLTSGAASVSFSISPPALSAPSAPTLGAPVIS